MKGTLRNNFLTLDCNMSNYFLLPSGPASSGENRCTNVCGIAQINGVFYCAKTNTSAKTAVYAYTSSEDAEWITSVPLSYYCVDMAAYGSDLLLLGRTTSDLSGQSVIIHLTTEGVIQEVYSVDFDAVGLTYYKKESNQDYFMVLRNSTDKVNLTVEVGTLNGQTGSFAYLDEDKINLKNTGYTYRIQGIHYADGPLLLVTNNDYSTCENAIMVYSNLYCPKDVYHPTAKFYVKPISTGYTQFNIEGACADENGILSIVMNGGGSGTNYGDAVKKIPITFTDHRFEVELGLIRGSHVPNQNQCHNFGTMALDGSTLYGIKTATGDTHQILFKANDYTDYVADDSSARSKLIKIKEYNNASDESQALLGHANGMELCNNHMFVCGSHGIERLTMSGEFSKRYATPELNVKGLAWDNTNPSVGRFYALESKRNNGADGYKYYPLHTGILTGTEYTNAELLGYVRIGLQDVDDGPMKEGTQDIFHRAGIGLFIVYNKGIRNEAGVYPVQKSALLHVDEDAITIWDGQPRVIPDYAFTVTSGEYTNEIESGAFDEINDRLVLCSNYGDGDCVWYTNSDWVFQKE